MRLESPGLINIPECVSRDKRTDVLAMAVYGELKGLWKILTSKGLESVGGGGVGECMSNLGTYRLFVILVSAFSSPEKWWASVNMSPERLLNTDEESLQTWLWLHGPPVLRVYPTGSRSSPHFCLQRFSWRYELPDQPPGPIAERSRQIRSYLKIKRMRKTKPPLQFSNSFLS